MKRVQITDHSWGKLRSILVIRIESRINMSLMDQIIDSVWILDGDKLYYLLKKRLRTITLEDGL